MIAKAALSLALLAGPADLTPEVRSTVENWFSALAQRQAGESFGALSTRAARLTLGTPYDDTPQRAGPERLVVRTDRLHCVSLVEYSDALARCLWQDSPTAECFATQVEQTRYRDGELSDYGSRLHYFVDWLADNDRRGRIKGVSEDLGAISVTQPFYFMTRH
ncbi:MAG: N-acetylmuramoyl-L-alanine amidase-like domain-containing protein, partial [Myxococcota bacterium]